MGLNNMVPIKTTVIPVWPSTNVRSTQSDKWLFAVSDEYLDSLDDRKEEENGKRGGNLRRKRQLEKYNAYKEEISYWAKVNSFVLPSGSFSVWFYIPFPKSWTKKKCAAMCGSPHTHTPDLDNLIKALLDGLFPRRNRAAGEAGADDRRIHNYIAFKLWCAPGDEKIVIQEYSPKDMLDAFPPPAPILFDASRKVRSDKKSR